ncbi:hypothetical protein SAMN02745196_02901 [Clostridium collagenovorans DSM 3089]|uniref:Secreted protein n=1 Tax=Clostridium collagenovorans DSM 3089 TaxID=1121306 RepID=A0A1M5YFZ5_9CLOT|nr:hypothetical protein [Clostridium collagenovorans]SHI10829.1 hypothetical protein SAMN02745196_02901 [Clostridium collagenovorans DSM 3089]
MKKILISTFLTLSLALSGSTALASENNNVDCCKHSEVSVEANSISPRGIPCECGGYCSPRTKYGSWVKVGGPIKHGDHYDYKERRTIQYGQQCNSCGRFWLDRTEVDMRIACY